MPPWGDPDRELVCHVSHGGVLCGVATWAFGGGPYNTDRDTESILPYYQYLKACVRKVTTGCRPQIFGYLFKDGPTIASHCCEQLGSVGIDCHKSLTTHLVAIPEFSSKEDQMISKATELIEKCPPPKNWFALPPSIWEWISIRFDFLFGLPCNPITVRWSNILLMPL